MHVDTATCLTFGLLIAAYIACWLAKMTGAQKVDFPGARGLFFLSLCSGVYNQILHFPAVMAMGGLALLAHLYFKSRLSKPWRTVVLVLVIVLTLLLALHKVPGFANPLLMDRYRFSADSLPFTLYASYDKAAAGFILFSFVIQDQPPIRPGHAVWKNVVFLGVTNLVLLTVTGLWSGLVRVDLKWPDFSPGFLLFNFFLTCISEEVFFRGVLQTKLADAMRGSRGATGITVLISAALFGVAHIGGGPVYVLLATLAGLFYAIGFARTRRLEVPILLHFAFNAFQFIFLSYPALAPR